MTDIKTYRVEIIKNGYVLEYRYLSEERKEFCNSIEELLIKIKSDLEF